MRNINCAIEEAQLSWPQQYQVMDGWAEELPDLKYFF